MVDLLVPFLSIILIDLVLAGDNALIIAMAARGLPPRERRLAVLWGGFAAVVLRVVFTALTAVLLQIPWVRALGGLALLHIAWRLVNDGHEGRAQVEAGVTVWSAIRIIIIADAVMSLDNVLALAEVSQGQLWLLVGGVLLTVPLIVWGAGILASMMTKASWLVGLGAALLFWTGAQMLLAEPVFRSALPGYIIEHLLLVKGVCTAVLVLTAYKAKSWRQARV